MLVFWRLPVRYRYWFLALASMAFLAVIIPGTVALMSALAVAVYWLSRPGQTSVPAGVALKISIALLCAYLFYFKYLPALGGLADGYNFADIALPMGISYFTFKLIHYAIEQKRGNLPAHGFGDYLSYVFLVPIFTAGPIQRFEMYQADRSETWSRQFAIEGLYRIALGLIKKFVIGAQAFAVMEKITNGNLANYIFYLEDRDPLGSIVFLCAAYIFVYMDFAGYTDIAIGTSRMFGLKIMENFNFPFLAKNIGNLWKRWHMSLSNWCQTYIYMPTLGLTRNPYYAAIASFTVMGLWHGATLNFLFWGFYNALGVSVYQWFNVTARKRKWKFQKTRLFGLASYPMTFFFFAGSFAFTMTDQKAGLWGAFRLLAKCFFINLPAKPW